MTDRRPTALVTGCDAGIGREFVRQYAAAGTHVIATGLGAAAPDFGPDCPPFEYRRLDVTDHAMVDDLASALAGTSIDILVHNAGIGRPHPRFGHTDYALWRRMLEVNLIGPFKLTEALVSSVAASDLKTIAFVSSRMGSIGLNNSGRSYAYRSSKAGLNMVVKSLAVDLASRDICVLALHPGRVGGSSLSVEESVAGMRRAIAQAGPFQTGAFMSFDGQLLPW